MTKEIEAVGILLCDELGRGFLTRTSLWTQYLLPGGKVELGETKEQAIRREVQEELGVGIADLVEVRTDIIVPGVDLHAPHSHALSDGVVFRVTSYVGRPVGKLRPEQKFVAYGWYTPEQTKELPIPSVVRELFDYQRSTTPNA